MQYFFLFRNNSVFNSRSRIRRKIYTYNLKCIYKGIYDADKIDYDKLDEIYSYDKIMFMFYIPIKKMEKEILDELGLS